VAVDSQRLAKNVETLLKVNAHLGVYRTELDEACEYFLWETDEIPLARRLQLADWYAQHDLFVSSMFYVFGTYLTFKLVVFSL
jgi:hypothetical protein